MTLYLPQILRWSDKVADFVLSSPTLRPWMEWNCEMRWRCMGHYKLGLKLDDIICDRIDIVEEALKRISDQEAFERTFRIRRAMQLQLTNSTLDESEWPKFEDDKPYLYHHIKDICAERAEHKRLQTLFSKKRALFM